MCNQKGAQYREIFFFSNWATGQNLCTGTLVTKHIIIVCYKLNQAEFTEFNSASIRQRKDPTNCILSTGQPQLGQRTSRDGFRASRSTEQRLPLDQTSVAAA